MVSSGGFFTRFNIFLWCGIGFLFVSLYHIVQDGYNHRAGFMLMLGLALLVAAFMARRAGTNVQEGSIQEEVIKDDALSSAGR